MMCPQSASTIKRATACEADLDPSGTVGHITYRYLPLVGFKFQFGEIPI